MILTKANKTHQELTDNQQPPESQKAAKTLREGSFLRNTQETSTTIFFFLNFPSSLISKGETTFLSYLPHLQSCVCREDHTGHSLVTHHQEQKLFCHQGEAPKTPGASMDVKKVQLGIIRFASYAFTCRFFIPNDVVHKRLSSK